MSNQEFDFILNITDGNAFKNVISIIKAEQTTIDIFIYKDKVRISFLQTSKDDTVNQYGHYITLSMDTNFNPRSNNGQVPDFIVMGFKTKLLYNAIKSITKKDSLIIYRSYYDDDDPVILIKHVKNNSHQQIRSGAVMVRILIPKLEQALFDDTIKSYNSVKVPAKSFSDVIKIIGDLECENLNIDGYNNGVVFNGITSEHTNAITEPYGFDFNPNNRNLNFKSYINSNEFKVNKIISCLIPRKKAKALSKFSVIANNPLIELDFYFLNEYIAIKGPISNFGEYIIFISPYYTQSNN